MSIWAANWLKSAKIAGSVAKFVRIKSWFVCVSSVAIVSGSVVAVLTGGATTSAKRAMLAMSSSAINRKSKLPSWSPWDCPWAPLILVFCVATCAFVFTDVIKAPVSISIPKHLSCQNGSSFLQLICLRTDFPRLYLFFAAQPTPPWQLIWLNLVTSSSLASPLQGLFLK